MGAFEVFPYTNFHDMNLDWILRKLKDFEGRLDTALAEAVAEANKYTDSKMQDFRNEFNELLAEIEQAQADLEKSNADFQNAVNQSIRQISDKVDNFADELTNGLKGANAYTDAKIEQNNDYIISQVQDQFVGVKVINFFTGQAVTVQEMFDTLAQYHLQNPLTYTQLASRDKTYTTLAALNITYQELVTNGASLITA